jgi:predicted MFS family arabinose efflux permease
MQQHFQREAKECKFEDQFISHRIWHIWIIFVTTWFIFTKQFFSYLYVKNTCFDKSKDLTIVNLIKYQKLFLVFSLPFDLI